MSNELWGKRKATLMVAIILVFVLCPIGVIYYQIMHNTFVYSFVIADDRIIASDGDGSYRVIGDNGQPSIDGVLYGRDEDIYLGCLSLNSSSRSVIVNFTQAPWKDANLMDVPSRLPSKNYRMKLFLLVIGYEGKPVDWYKMGIGEYLRYKSLQIQVQFHLNDYDTGQFKGLYVWRDNETDKVTFDFTTRSIYRYYDVWLPTKTPEPPQSLRDDGYMTLTRIGDEKWALDVNAWFLTYYLTIRGDMLKYCVKLSLYLTISRHRAM